MARVLLVLVGACVLMPALGLQGVLQHTNSLSLSARGQFTVGYKTGDTLENLKAKYQDKAGIPPTEAEVAKMQAVIQIGKDGSIVFHTHDPSTANSLEQLMSVTDVAKLFTPMTKADNEAMVKYCQNTFDIAKSGGSSNEMFFGAKGKIGMKTASDVLWKNIHPDGFCGMAGVYMYTFGPSTYMNMVLRNKQPTKGSAKVWRMAVKAAIEGLACFPAKHASDKFAKLRYIGDMKSAYTKWVLKTAQSQGAECVPNFASTAYSPLGLAHFAKNNDQINKEGVLISIAAKTPSRGRFISYNKHVHMYGAGEDEVLYEPYTQFKYSKVVDCSKQTTDERCSIRGSGLTIKYVIEATEEGPCPGYEQAAAMPKCTSEHLKLVESSARM